MAGGGKLPPPPPALPVADHQPRHMRRAVIGRSQIGVGVVVSRQSTLRSGFSRGEVDREGRKTQLLVEG